MKEQEKILTFFKKHNLNIKARPDFKGNKKILFEAAQETMRLLEAYTEETLRTEVIQKMFEVQVEEKTRANKALENEGV